MGNWIQKGAHFLLLMVVVVVTGPEIGPPNLGVKKDGRRRRYGSRNWTPKSAVIMGNLGPKGAHFLLLMVVVVVAGPEIGPPNRQL